jgi:hypothetical protein
MVASRCLQQAESELMKSNVIYYYSVIQLCLIIWKITGLLNVAWWIVLLPTLGPIGIGAFIALVMVLAPWV